MRRSWSCLPCPCGCGRWAIFRLGRLVLGCITLRDQAAAACDHLTNPRFHEASGPAFRLVRQVSALMEAEATPLNPKRVRAGNVLTDGTLSRRGTKRHR